MYYEYSLYAVPAILVTGLAAWLYLKWRGLAEGTRLRNLVYGTATAILIALLMPVTARLFYHRAGLPVAASLIAAFASLAIAAGLVLYLAHIVAASKEKEGEKAAGYQGSVAGALQESAAALEELRTPPEAPHEVLQSPTETQHEDLRILPETSHGEQLTPDEVHDAGLQVLDETLYEDLEIIEKPLEDLQILPETFQADKPEPSEEPYEELQPPEGPWEEPQTPYQVHQVEAETVDTAQIIDKIGDDEHLPEQDNVDALLTSAMEFKMGGSYPEAVSCYRRALEYIQDKELLTWVVIDLCGLAKILKDDSIIQDVLDSEQGKMLDSGIITEILNNI